LKGGAAMRVLTGSARFTQDLDFDHDPHRSLASLQNTVRSAIDRAIHASGLMDTSISEAKQTDTVARWKISGRTNSGENMHLAVEVSRRQTPDPNHVVKIPVQIADRTLPRVYISVYDEQALADNKLAALIDDRRTAFLDTHLHRRGRVSRDEDTTSGDARAVSDKSRRRYGHMKALHWSTRLELVLAEPSALRVLDTASIVQLAKNVRQDISKASVERWIQEAVAANRLRRVVRGLFLNRLTMPAPQLCEAAVVPLSSRYATPSLGRVETAGGTFVFRGLPERVLETGPANDRLVAGVDYRRATPEAAMLPQRRPGNLAVLTGLPPMPDAALILPASTLNLSAFNVGRNGVSGSVNFAVGDADNMIVNGPNSTAFSQLGGDTGQYFAC
jgi:predicted nucleotidyltransferase component of viral defense system